MLGMSLTCRHPVDPDASIVHTNVRGRYVLTGIPECYSIKAGKMPMWTPSLDMDLDVAAEC